MLWIADSIRLDKLRSHEVKHTVGPLMSCAVIGIPCMANTFNVDFTSEEKIKKGK
jgi:hypothetical protein